MEIVDTQQQQMTDTVATGFMPMELNDHTPDEIVVFQSLALAEEWRTFKKFFDENKHWLVELKKRMGCKQGVEGKKMNFNGAMLTWNEFVAAYMKVTPAYMRMLLGEKPEKKESSGDKPKKHYTEDDLVAAREEGYEEGYATAAQEYESNEGEAADESEPQPSDDIPELDAAHQRIAELEAEIEKLNAAPNAMQLMSEKEKVLAYAKRISGGRAEMLKLVFDEITDSLGLSDRITVTVE
ncbi:MAG TPA: hypothetical protein VE957_19100 [Terriglobales bacterium]|nr:hypothetical protein [Terriglobales bacterium]